MRLFFFECALQRMLFVLREAVDLVCFCFGDFEGVDSAYADAFFVDGEHDVC